MFIIILLTMLGSIFGGHPPTPEDDWIERYSNYMTSDKVFLNMVIDSGDKGDVVAPAYMSVEVETSFATAIKYLADRGTVKTTVDWYSVESSPDVYDWRLYDTKMEQLSGHPLILTIRNAPNFYRKWSNYICSPPRAEYYPKYVRFAQAVVDRYKPTAIEIWNEPDVGRVDEDIWYFGCWLEVGGGTYGEFVRYVYDRLDFRGMVFGGAFMLSSTEQKNFAIDAVTKAGDSVDGWSYHSYPYYGRNTNDFNQFVRKANFLRGVTNKPLYLSETSLLCKDEWKICDNKFESEKAQYFEYVYNSQSVNYFTWFEVKNTWNNCSLIARNGDELPAYFTYISLSK